MKFQEEAQVLAHDPVAQSTFRLRLRAPNIAGSARAGQFLMLTVREGLDPLLKRPFSFHRILPEEGAVEILYRVVGRGTWQLSKAAPGTKLPLIGPLGNGFTLPQEVDSPVVLIAGGIGVAPLFPLLADLAARRSGMGPGGIHLFYGARTGAELLPSGNFKDFGVSLHVSTDDGTLGFGGYVTDLFQKTMERIRPAMIYACGPLAMQVRLARWAMERSAPSQLSLESLMACGIGACLGCALPAPHPTDPTADHYVHVCSDGPIFPAGAIQWSRIQSQQIHTPTFMCS